MLTPSKIKILITFVFCYLIKKVNTNYISFRMLKVDDCVRLVNISNKISSQIVVNFSDQNTFCDTSFSTHGPCQDNNWTLYADKDGYLIKDYEYEFMNEVAITFEDWNHQNGFMAMEVYFNEYLINYTDQTFWECKDCEHGKENSSYIFGNTTVWKNFKQVNITVFLFHSGGPNECFPMYYTFVFKIDNITELYKGTKNGTPFLTTTSPSNYYTFPIQEQNRTFLKNVTYSEGDIELELINFYLQYIIYAKNNHSMVFKNKFCFFNNDTTIAKWIFSDVFRAIFNYRNF